MEKILIQKPSPITSPPKPIFTPPVTPKVKVQATQTILNPPTRMECIIAPRYEPLVLPQDWNAFRNVDYMKYFLKFSGEGEVTA